MKKWGLLTLGLVLIAFLSSWLWKSNWAAIHFVDEEDNMVAGELMVEGKVLYKDIFSHHQPATYLISREFQKTKPANSIFELIKNHRFIVVVWAMVWWILIVIKVGYPGIILGLVYEIIKYKYLGNLFLGESLSVYPLIYALIISLKDKRNKKEMVVAGIALALAWWLVASNAVVVAILGIYLFLKDKNRWWLLGGGILISIIVLSQLPLKEYWQNGIWTNLKIYIPNTQNRAAFGWSLNIFWIIVAGLILINIKKFSWVWWAALIATGLRGVQLNHLYYGGFHFLPWVGIMLTGITLKNKKWGHYQD